jgi:hypothetical protein
MLNENINLQEEFNKRVQRLKEGNLFRIKQLANFMKFYNEDKKSMVEYFRDSFIVQEGDIPKIMFEVITDVISTTFYKESRDRNSYYIIFCDMLYKEFTWMVKKFKTKEHIEIVSNLIRSWSEPKWGPMKEAIYLKDVTDYLLKIIEEHKNNLEDEKYRKGLDDEIFAQNFNSRANMFITEGLKNNFIREYFNLDLRDKILEEQYRNNVDKETFMNLMNSTDENLLNRRKNTAIKYKPIFLALKEKLMEQIVRRELFIKQLINNRDNLYQDFVQNLKK